MAVAKSGGGGDSDVLLRRSEGFWRSLSSREAGGHRGDRDDDRCPAERTDLKGVHANIADEAPKLGRDEGRRERLDALHANRVQRFDFVAYGFHVVARPSDMFRCVFPSTGRSFASRAARRRAKSSPA